MANVINSDCSICLESLANNSNLASLFCGHVFHHECILNCSERQRTTCPLCQKDMHLYQHPVIRLYLELDSANNISNSEEPDARYQKLKKAHIDLNDKMATLERKYAQKKKRLEHCEQQWRAAELQKKKITDQMNRLKHISGILDLESRIKRQDVKQQMQHWRQLDKDELCDFMAAVVERNKYLDSELNSHHKLLKRANQRIGEWKSRYRTAAYEDQPTSSSNPSGHAKRKRLFNPDELLSTKKRDKQPIIQVDTDEETDDPDDMFWVQPTNTNIKEKDALTRSRQAEQSSSSSTSSTNDTPGGGQSRQQMSETAKKLARRKRLQQIGIYGNGFLPPVAINTAENGHRNDSSANNSDSNDNTIEDEDEVTINDEDDGYDSPSSPLPPLRIVSPVRHITSLPQLARLSRVIELSSDEEDVGYM